MILIPSRLPADPCVGWSRICQWGRPLPERVASYPLSTSSANLPRRSGFCADGVSRCCPAHFTEGSRAQWQAANSSQTSFLGQSLTGMRHIEHHELSSILPSHATSFLAKGSIRALRAFENAGQRQRPQRQHSQ